MCKSDIFGELKSRLRHNWRLVVCIFAPIVLSPVALVGYDGQEHEHEHDTAFDPNKKFRTAYVIILMAVFWVLELIPLAITSLFPLALFPLLNVQDAATVSKNYMKESNMIFLGAIILALAIEYCGLHIRVALRVISICGTNPARVMLGTMTVTAMLAMWISATSCTTMIIPILSAITSAMFREEQSEIMIHHRNHSVGEVSRTEEDSTHDTYLATRARRQSHVFANSALQGHLNSARQRSKKSESSKVSPGPPNVVAAVSSKTVIPINSGYSLSDWHGRWVNEERASLEENAEEKARKESVSSRTLSSVSFIVEGAGVPPPKDEEDNAAKSNNPEETPKEQPRNDSVDETGLETNAERERNIGKMLLFAVAYSASIGGTGSLVGTGPIKVFKELIKEYKLDKNKKLTGITFTTWMGFNIPPLIVNIIITWIFLAFRYIGFKRLYKKDENADMEKQKVKEYLKDEFQRLGPITAHQIGVAVIFVSVVILWLLRDPQLFPGWNSWTQNTATGDSTPAMIGVILLFAIPKSWSFLKCGKKKYVPEHTYEALLDWKFVSSNAPWGYILLIGSGYAIADASQKSQLSQFIGEELSSLRYLSNQSLLIIVMFLTSLITEVVSNTACASLILPVLFSVSCGLKIHPSYLTMASAITASYAFMLPISSPPNAIIFATGQLRYKEMLCNGLFLNIVCNLVLYVAFITYGELFFGFSSFHSHIDQNYQNCTTFNAEHDMNYT